MQPAAAPGGAFVFSSLRSSVDLWKLPMHTVEAKVAGPMQRLTDSAAPTIYPSLSTDGRKVIFSSKKAGSFQIWLKDLESKKETSLATIGAPDMHGTINRGGSKVAYRGTENQKPV